MALKTKLEFLEDCHNQILFRIVQQEIDIANFEESSLIISPGEEYAKIKEAVKVGKVNLEKLNKIILLIKGMILKERGNAGKKTKFN